MRAEDAKRLHDDPALKEAMTLLRARYHKKFENADLSDPDSLYTVRVKFDLIRDFYSELQKVLNEESMKK